MPQQMIWIFVSIAFSLVAWGIVTARYIWPELRLRPRVEARANASPVVCFINSPKDLFEKIRVQSRG